MTGVDAHPRFLTDTGVEVPAVTAQQMRDVDRTAMHETGPNLYQMMENAGRSLALLAIEVLGNARHEANVVVLAGSGGNGGGGICAARHLANRSRHVSLCVAQPGRLGEVPSFQRKVYLHTGGKEIDAVGLQGEPADLIVDALIGYGLRSAPDRIVAELIRWANAANAPVLALDIPSGVDATTGQTPGDFVQARWTLALALPKKGLAAQATGDLYLADIGIPMGVYARVGLAHTNPFGDRFCVPLTCSPHI